MDITFIGDVHGKVHEYNQLIQRFPLTIQVGDFGFINTYKQIQSNSQYHKILGGNHDDYTKYNGVFHHQTKHFLGDFGTWNNIFYVRGANSIDRYQRTPFVDWWPEEEMSIQQLSEAIHLYSQIQPSYVVSHDCPQFLAEKYLHIQELSKTRCALDEMFNIHKPKRWIFGHHHITLDIQVYNTIFSCIDELQTLTIKQEEI